MEESHDKYLYIDSGYLLKEGWFFANNSSSSETVMWFSIAGESQLCHQTLLLQINDMFLYSFIH